MVNGVKPSVARWCRSYAERGVRIGYLARLFNVDPIALSLAIRHERRRG